MTALGATGFNTLANTGESAGQTVFHCHIHVIPRYDDASRIVSWTPREADNEAQKEIAKKISENIR